MAYCDNCSDKLSQTNVQIAERVAKKVVTTELGIHFLGAIGASLAFALGDMTPTLLGNGLRWEPLALCLSVAVAAIWQSME